MILQISTNNLFKKQLVLKESKIKPRHVSTNRALEEDACKVEPQKLSENFQTLEQEKEKVPHLGHEKEVLQRFHSNFVGQGLPRRLQVANQPKPRLNSQTHSSGVSHLASWKGGEGSKSGKLGGGRGRFKAGQG